MIEKKRETLFFTVFTGVIQIFDVLSEKTDHPCLDVVPMLAAQTMFYTSFAAIEYRQKDEFFAQADKTVLSAKGVRDENIQVVTKFALAFFLQLGIFFVVSHLRKTSYKVWFTTLVLKSLEKGFTAVINCNKSLITADIQRLESCIKETQDEIDEATQKTLISEKNFLTFLAAIQNLINFFIIRPSLSSAQRIRSPNFNAFKNWGFICGSLLSCCLIQQRKITSESRFLAAFVLGLGGNFTLHYGLQKQGVLIGSFSWRRAIIWQGINVCLGGLFFSIYSPLYTPPAIVTSQGDNKISN